VKHIQMAPIEAINIRP